MSMPRCLLVTALSSLAFAPAELRGLDLTNFRNCVSSSGTGSTCTLDPNWSGGGIIPWDVTTPIAVQRAVTVQGNLSYPGQVILERAAAVANMMYIAPSGSGATIKNLEFDGNKAAYAGGSFTDLDVQSGTWNIVIRDCTFRNAPDFAVNVNYYTYIHYSNFYDARLVGILTYNPYSNNTDIGVYNSTFAGVGTNAIYLSSGSRNSILYDNFFYENHKTCAWGSPGGQILLDETTSGITVQNNDVDGNLAYCGPSYPSSSAGLEGYGSSHLITGNTFSNHRWFGMYFTGASGIEISYNIVEYNQSNGVNLTGTVGGWPPCSPWPTYTMTSNTIRHNSGWGIYAAKSGCTAGPSSSTISLSGNTFVGNGSGATSLNNP